MCDIPVDGTVLRSILVCGDSNHTLALLVAAPLDGDDLGAGRRGHDSPDSAEPLVTNVLQATIDEVTEIVTRCRLAFRAVTYVHAAPERGLLSL